MQKVCSLAVCVTVMALALAGCDARFDPKTGSGSPANAASAASASRQMDPR